MTNEQIMQNELFDFSYQVQLVDKINEQLIYIQAVHNILTTANNNITIYIVDEQTGKHCTISQSNVPFNLSQELTKLLKDSMLELTRHKLSIVRSL